MRESKRESETAELHALARVFVLQNKLTSASGIVAPLDYGACLQCRLCPKVWVVAARHPAAGNIKRSGFRD